MERKQGIGRSGTSFPIDIHFLLETGRLAGRRTAVTNVHHIPVGTGGSGVRSERRWGMAGTLRTPLIFWNQRCPPSKRAFCLRPGRNSSGSLAIEGRIAISAIRAGVAQW